MKSLEDEKLKMIKGGGINWSLMAGIGAVVSFFVGIVDGLINPQKCNN